jgi:hypothetical protein
MATLIDLRGQLAEDVQPSNPAAKLSDGQLDRAIKYALAKYDSSLEIEDLDEAQQLAVLTGAAAKCYWLLATKYAEGMQVEIENDKFFNEQPFEHYIKLAKELDGAFAESCGGATIEVSTLRRRSLRTGQIVPLPPGETQ